MRSWLKRDRSASESGPDDADLRAAYERGRRDERARRRKRPLLGLVVTGAALVGGAALALAAMQGSFRDGGAVMDTQIAVAASHAEPAIRHVAGEATEAIRGSSMDVRRDVTSLDG